MVQVESEAIAEIDYDAADSVLFVHFAHGDWYSYFGVEPNVYKAFVPADSHGRFFHEHLRDLYPYSRGQSLP